MNKKNILSFLIGLVISVVVNGAVYISLLLATFDLFGFTSIKDPESLDAKTFYTSLITTLFFIAIAIITYKKSKRFFAIGFALPGSYGLVLLISVAPTFLNKSNYYEKFNRNNWEANPESRIKMARYLVKEKELIGLTKEQVIKKLGDVDFYTDNEMNYVIEEDYYGLGVQLEDNKVSDCGIWVKD